MGPSDTNFKSQTFGFGCLLRWRKGVRHHPPQQSQLCMLGGVSVSPKPSPRALVVPSGLVVFMCCYLKPRTLRVGGEGWWCRGLGCRARDIVLKAAEVHAICQLAPPDEEASQSGSVIASRPRSPTPSQPDCASFPALSRTVDPAALEVDALDGRHMHLGMDAEAHAMLEELRWAHRARAMVVHELDEQLEAARSHVRAREEEDTVLAGGPRPNPSPSADLC